MVFVAGKGSPTVRPRPRRSARTSKFVYQAQADTSQVSQAWSSLTATEQLAWRTASQASSSTNRLGTSAPNNGFQLFMKFHLGNHLLPTIETEPPALLKQNGIPTTVTATFSQSGTLEVQAQPQAGFGTDNFLVFGTIYFRDYDARNVRKWIFIVKVSDTVLDDDIRTEWEEHFGPPVEDQRFSIAVASGRGNGFRSQLVILDQSVTA